MKSLRRELHPIDHSLIFHEQSEALTPRLERRPQRKAKRERWIQQVGKRISNRLFNFETKNISLSL